MICPYQDLGQPEEDWCENPENCEIYKERIQEKEKLAKRNLMLTAEQREALEYAIEALNNTNCPECGTLLMRADPTEAISVIGDLLSSSKRAWEATEERIEAIRYAMASSPAHATVLRDMLEVVEHFEEQEVTRE